jgi:Na+-translocating ferredoxin:NAD+ oxidoreductase RNF subunit RnfB
VNQVILYSVVALGIVAAVSAVVLFVVAKKFKVEEDPRVDELNALLPGVNCGGCGYAGCRNMAEALVKAADQGDITAFTCPAGGAGTMAALGKYLGIKVAETIPMIAVVRCGGARDKAPAKLNYDGPSKCAISHRLYSGHHGCPYGCLGLGDCVPVCKFDAIYIDNQSGLPVVREDKCTACGACVKACPRFIIELRPRGPENKRVWINCVNKEKGAVAMKNCKVACIACGKCVRECPQGAITLTDNLAYIHPDKCTVCEKCILVCPTNAIAANFTPTISAAQAQTELKTKNQPAVKEVNL